MKKSRIICVIPARLASTRFPRKILALLGGKPLIQWAFEAAIATGFFDRVVVAVDSCETAAVVALFGAEAMMTSPDCLSGTERIIELVTSGALDGDIFVNWQGDEPFICREMIADLLQVSSASIWTLKKRITASESSSPHLVKVVTDQRGLALYFSRAQIPHYRDNHPNEKKLYYKHIGLYAYTREALHQMAHLPPSGLEMAEQLEQLRYLESGLKIGVHETQQQSVGIDLPEHLDEAEKYLAALSTK